MVKDEYPRLLVWNGKHGPVEVLIQSQEDRKSAWFTMFMAMDFWAMDFWAGFYRSRYLLPSEKLLYGQALRGDHQAAIELLETRSSRGLEHEFVREESLNTPQTLYLKVKGRPMPKQRMSTAEILASCRGEVPKTSFAAELRYVKKKKSTKKVNDVIEYFKGWLLDFVEREDKTEAEVPLRPDFSLSPEELHEVVGWAEDEGMGCSFNREMGRLGTEQIVFHFTWGS